MVYDPKTKQNEVLVENLYFSNGVHLAHDESFILVAETLKARVWRYHLKGPKKGTSDLFVEKLPGLPDNVHLNKNNEFVISLVDPGSPMLVFMAQQPYVRKFVARLLTIVQWTVREINNLVPNYWLERTHHLIGHFEMLRPLHQKRVTVVVCNKNGEVTHSLHTTDGNVASSSSITSFNGYYYLGSPYNNYLARVKIPRST